MSRMYGRLAFRDGKWTMDGIEPHVAIKLKAMFTAVPKTSTGPFTFPATDDTAADLEWFLSRYPMAMADNDRERLTGGREAFTRARDDVEMIFVPEWQPTANIAFKEGRELYRYQHQAVEVTRRKKQLLLLDDVGLGKTVTALGVLIDGQHLPAAIIVPPHVRTQWLKDYIQKFTDMTGHIIKGTVPYELPPADIYIFSYSNIAGWVDVAATGVFKAVVYDEIQELRNGVSTSKGAAARVFTAHAQLRMGLTATPVYNYGSEMFNVVQAVAPGALGTHEDFLREWCTGHNGKMVVKDPDALGTYLREIQLTLRRQRTGAPINSIVLEVDYDEKVEADAEALMRTLAMKVMHGSFVERGQAARELDMYARMITGVAKARYVAAYVRMLLQAGTPVLLAGWHRECYEIWGRELADFRPVLYTGSESPAQKDRAKAAFMAGDTDLMMISLRSGAGLDGLQLRCCDAVIGELDWSPKVHDQLLGRLDRPGQTREVNAHFLHANGGSDPLLVSTLGLKSSQSRGIVDPMSAVQAVHSDESRIRMLAQQLLHRSAAE